LTQGGVDWNHKYKVMTKPYYKKPKFILYNEDALKVLESMRENSVDMIFADPPAYLPSH